MNSRRCFDLISFIFLFEFFCFIYIIFHFFYIFLFFSFISNDHLINTDSRNFGVGSRNSRYGCEDKNRLLSNTSWSKRLYNNNNQFAIFFLSFDDLTRFITLKPYNHIIINNKKNMWNIDRCVTHLILYLFFTRICTNMSAIYMYIYIRNVAFAMSLWKWLRTRTSGYRRMRQEAK